MAWFADSIFQGFKWTPGSTQAHSGIDVGTPCGTVLTSPVNGTVLNSGVQRWGGQVDILTPPGELPAPYDPSSSYVVSFLHLSREDVRPGPVKAGQQIGLSGMPPPGYGSGCHTHFEVTHGSVPPYTGYNPWYPTARSYPVSGAPLLGAINAGTGIAQGVPLDATNKQAATVGSHCFQLPFGQQVCIPQVVYEWVTQPIRVLKLAAGILLMSAGFVLFALPSSLQLAGVVSGQPELTTTGTLLKGKRGGRSAARARGVQMFKQGFSSQPRAKKKQAAPPAAAPAATPASAGGTP